MGFDISRIGTSSHPLARRRALLESFEIRLVLDVGAGAGGFAKQMRKDIGYSGTIISFEPLSSAFKLLEEAARADTKWDVINCAIGDMEEKTTINIAGNSTSSSLLNMLPLHEKAAPDSIYVANESVNVKTLDHIFDDLAISEKNIYLKIDTQGFEAKVLKGAEKSLKRIDTIQLEMSLVPLYESETAFKDLYDILDSQGYTLVGFEPGFSDRISGQMLQLDGIFHRFLA